MRVGFVTPGGDGEVRAEPRGRTVHPERWAREALPRSETVLTAPEQEDGLQACVRGEEAVPTGPEHSLQRLGREEKKEGWGQGRLF